MTWYFSELLFKLGDRHVYDVTTLQGRRKREFVFREEMRHTAKVDRLHLVT